MRPARKKALYFFSHFEETQQLNPITLSSRGFKKNIHQIFFPTISRTPNAHTAPNSPKLHPVTKETQYIQFDAVNTLSHLINVRVVYKNTVIQIDFEKKSPPFITLSYVFVEGLKSQLVLPS